jgi:hypothetical protein
VARLLGGVRSIVAESLILKRQLLIVTRSRQRSPNLCTSDRILAGLMALLVRPTRLLRSAIVLKPSTLLGLHKALGEQKLIGSLRREYLDHLLFWTTSDLENKLLDFRTYFNNDRTHTSREGRTPDTPVSRPIASLRSFGWQPHCRSLFQTPMAA